MVESSEGRVVLVTGGGRGIGRAIAGAFAAQGDRVAVTYRSAPVDGFVSVRCDVTDPEQVDAAISEVEEQLGPVSVLVANAGVTSDQLLVRMKDEDFTSVIDANLTGAWRVARRVARGMMRARSGRIIFISSVVGLTGQAGQSNYAASKAGLVGLARSIARELGSRNVTANVVAPGPVATEMLADLEDSTREAIVDSIPLGRVAEPDEIAAAVTFLAGPGAGYITGAVLPVDGGLGMGH
jgi:3-oxoacyl-[acyl-carrier protein] reductase